MSPLWSLRYSSLVIRRTNMGEPASCLPSFLTGPWFLFPFGPVATLNKDYVSQFSVKLGEIRRAVLAGGMSAQVASSHSSECPWRRVCSSLPPSCWLGRGCNGWSSSDDLGPWGGSVLCPRMGCSQIAGASVTLCSPLAPPLAGQTPLSCGRNTRQTCFTQTYFLEGQR